MKVGPFNRELCKSVSIHGGWLFGVIGALISFIDFEEPVREKILMGFAIFMIAFYLVEWIHANILWKIGLKVVTSKDRNTTRRYI